MKTLQQRYGKWALVTGATSGIGREFALQLAEARFNIVAVSRTETSLKKLAAELQQQHGIKVRTVALDLTQTGAAQAIAERCADLEIDILIPNAGNEVAGTFGETEFERESEMLQLNVVAPMQLAHIFGGKMAARRRGAILFLSSILGYQGTPVLAGLGATKSYILSLGEALADELGRSGVDVTVLSPGLTRTPMIANMPLDVSKLPLFVADPADVARTGLRALGRKKTVVHGLWNRMLVFMNRLMPRSWPVKLFGFLLRRARVEDALALAAPATHNVTSRAA